MLIEFIKSIWGIIYALLRLISLSFVFLVNGIHGVLFNRHEIVGLTMHATPLSIEKDKVAYIDQLEKQNMDLACGMPLVPTEDFNNTPFREDDNFNDWDDEEDFDDEDDNGPKDEYRGE